MSRPLPAVWGHRGASRARPENTVEAFLEARAQGADGIELDVRRSADNALVVHHDAELADGRLIKNLTVGDLPPDVPLLAAALDACAGLDTINIEIKNIEVDADFDPTEYLAGSVAALVADRALHARVLVSSFSLATIDRVAKLDPDIRCGYLASPRWSQDEALARAIDHGHAAFHPHQLAVNAALVEAAHNHGLVVNTWTVDDPERMLWLAGVGVDALITNDPALARAVLSSS